MYIIDLALANGTTLDGKDRRDWAVNTVIRILEYTSHAESFLWPYHERFSEVEWKKSNATTQKLVCNYRLESVLCSVN